MEIQKPIPPEQETSGSSAYKTLDVLCSMCRSLFHDTLCMHPTQKSCRDDDHGQYHHHIRELKLSAASGCHLCCIILNQIENNGGIAFPEDFDLEEFTPWIMMDVEDMKGSDTELEVPDASCESGGSGDEKDEDWERDESREIYYTPSEGSARSDADNRGRPISEHSKAFELPGIPPSAVILGEPKRKQYWLLLYRERPREMIGSIGGFTITTSLDMSEKRMCSTNTSSAESLSQIRQWLDECLECHGDCSLNQITKGKPRRLPSRLLDVKDIGTKSSVRLLDTGDLPSETEYMSLSHCWGSKESLKLTQVSLDKFMTNIAESELPLTFRDAAHLAQRLGCPYIWIDSLCILQDSFEDWQGESSRMSETYSNSMLNIAASASIDCDGGLFRSRNPLSIAPCKIDASCQCTASQVIWCAGCNTGVSWLPLHRRAWAVQETILAHRVVFFGDQQLHWECNSSKAEEAEPQFSDQGDYSPRRRLNVPGALSPDVMGDEPISSKSHLYAWQLIVLHDYSRSDLSFERDKLVAISGIAKKIHEASDGTLGTYLAGLWSHQLSYQLAWNSEGRHSGHPTRPAEYRAPSWSWASVNGQIRPGWGGDSETKLLFTILDAQTVPISDPFGPVAGGFLKVSTLLCEVFLPTNTSEDDGGRSWCPWGSIENAGSAFDAPEIGDRTDNEEVWLTAQGNHTARYLMPMQRNKYGDMNALVLQHTGIKSGQFRRTGLSRPFRTLCKAIYEACVSQRLGEHLYETKEENNQYTIEIV